ncbi:MAG: hypothetical protein NZ524_04010 [Thiobacillaceae bacterium]|nr:hypothetical protein [Thiobacillaceae bacterium]MDW8323527.1 hypothetical protein [Burkholderiales bacterium]
MVDQTLATDLTRWLPLRLRGLTLDQTTLPRIAKDAALMREVEAVLPSIPRGMHCGDATHARWTSYPTTACTWS